MVTGYSTDCGPTKTLYRIAVSYTHLDVYKRQVMARRIAKEEGLFCGYSAGSCLQGLLQLKDELKKDDVVVCIFHDHGSRYVGKVYNLSLIHICLAYTTAVFRKGRLTKLGKNSG